MDQVDRLGRQVREALEKTMARHRRIANPEGTAGDTPRKTPAERHGLSVLHLEKRKLRREGNAQFHSKVWKKLMRRFGDVNKKINSLILVTDTVFQKKDNELKPRDLAEVSEEVIASKMQISKGMFCPR